eukprot:TRINITY_DN6243_c0_g1_i3.p1 TRINITY_DN6243_c0_g1~~TRINITY_DN6243_c0_g1_i3.p1  ORF type:complete len:383 (-),score=46.63 TRINITY_DN6243_c0_g1_i3:86-1138(-)
MWSAAESERLRTAVARYGEAGNWKKISEVVGGTRSPWQCNQRWTRVEAPGIHKGRWTAEEDALLLRLVTQYGKRFKILEENIPGRTDVQIRHRFERLGMSSLLPPEQRSPTRRPYGSGSSRSRRRSSRSGEDEEEDEEEEEEEEPEQELEQEEEDKQEAQEQSRPLRSTRVRRPNRDPDSYYDDGISELEPQPKPSSGKLKLEAQPNHPHSNKNSSFGGASYDSQQLQHADMLLRSAFSFIPRAPAVFPPASLPHESAFHHHTALPFSAPLPPTGPPLHHPLPRLAALQASPLLDETPLQPVASGLQLHKFQIPADEPSWLPPSGTMTSPTAASSPTPRKGTLPISSLLN